MKLLIDVSTGIAEFNSEEINAQYVDIYIGFRNLGEQDVPFADNFRFGYQILNELSLVSEKTYPIGPNRYNHTDQDYVEVARITELIPDTVYEIHFWMINDIVTVNQIFEFTTPKFPQPFQSWTWNNNAKCWVAPITYPEDGLDYEWDEVSQSWV